MRKTIPIRMILVTVVSLIACGGLEPNYVPGGTNPSTDYSSDDTNSTLEDPNKLNGGGLVARPMINVKSVACSVNVPVTGTAAPGLTIFVTGAALSSGIVTDAHPATGAFCLDVPLNRDAMNTIQVYAQDEQGNLSDPEIATVQQQGCSDGDDDVSEFSTEPKNIVFNAKMTSVKNPYKYLLDDVIDGDPDTYVEFRGGKNELWKKVPFTSGERDWNGWIWFQFDKLVELDRVAIRWMDMKGDGHSYGKKYRVLVSNATEPGEPENNGLWAVVAEVKDGNGGLDQFTSEFANKSIFARHVALQLGQDDRDDNVNLGLFTTDLNQLWDKSAGEERFKISEVEIWSRPSVTNFGSDLSKNSCVGLGAY